MGLKWANMENERGIKQCGGKDCSMYSFCGKHKDCGCKWRKHRIYSLKVQFGPSKGCSSEGGTEIPAPCWGWDGMIFRIPPTLGFWLNPCS